MSGPGDAYYNPYGGSAFNVFQSHDVDSSSANKTFVVANVAYNNDQKVDSTAINFNSKTDGNGIIIDTNRQFSYHGGTVVALNVAYNNGATSGGSRTIERKLVREHRAVRPTTGSVVGQPVDIFLDQKTSGPLRHRVSHRPDRLFWR